MRPRNLPGSGPRLSAHWRLLEHHEGDDPLSSVANLFDVAMVFAVALLMALTTHLRHLPTALSADADVTLVREPGTPEMEILRREGVELEHYKISEQTLGGDGEKLGTAYRLKTGEVVYVPEG